MERTVLLAGAGTPVGRATAERFCEAEWTVFAAARDEAGRDRLPDRDGLRRETIDVTDRRDVARVVERVTDETDRVDALVTLPGQRRLGPFEEVSPAALDRQLDVTVRGYHRLVRAVLPELRRREDGTVVTVTSAAARASFPGGGAYAGATAAVSAAADAVRTEVADDGISVVEVAPGPIGGHPDATGERADGERAAANGERADAGSTTDGDPAGSAATDGGVGDDERTGVYESVYGLLDDWTAIGPDNPVAVSPEAVADAIVNAASATEPAPRYPVGRLARIADVAPVLPRWLTEAGWSIARRFG